MKQLLRLGAVLLAMLLLSACGGGSGGGADTDKAGKPVITRLGGSTVTIHVGEAYHDAGVTATDDVDGNVTDKVVVHNPVDTSTEGVYTVTYDVNDSDGHEADQVKRLVVVYQPHPLKKTGQTRSFDEKGNEIHDGSIKDDGYYQRGVTPSYTRDDSTEIVTDNITGLQWQDNNDTETVTKPWLTEENYNKCTGKNNQPQDRSKCTDTSGDTAATYCSNLTLGGYSDWRLPTIDELMNIGDHSRAEPAAVDTTAFQHYVDPDSYNVAYWSSTEFGSKMDEAWEVSINYYGDFDCSKTCADYVRCVRTEN